MNIDDTNQTYIVLINDDQQLSIWTNDREIPAGWRAEGFSGSKSECIDHINSTWTDLRPTRLPRQPED